MYEQAAVSNHTAGFVGWLLTVWRLCMCGCVEVAEEALDQVGEGLWGEWHVSLCGSDSEQPAFGLRGWD